MTPLDALRDLQSRKLVEWDAFDKKVLPVELDLFPGMTEAEIDAFAATLPAPLPPDVRELLRVTRGMSLRHEVDFMPDEGSLGCPGMPHALPIMGDGTGNYWIVDLMPDSKSWGPIYFWCHDAPVVIYQCANLAEFILAVAELHTLGRPSILRDYEEQMWKVWGENRGLIPQPEAAAAPDPDLRTFAESLASDWLICDLRNPKPGDGFSWGRYQHDPEIRRAGNFPIFAYPKPPKKPGLLKRLFSR